VVRETRSENLILGNLAGGVVEKNGALAQGDWDFLLVDFDDEVSSNPAH
jgi:hypothetical protein